MEQRPSDQFHQEASVMKMQANGAALRERRRLAERLSARLEDHVARQRRKRFRLVDGRDGQAEQ
jgi:hypothetical protein